MNSPVLSVIIPVYNAQECLPVALKSVYDQGVDDIEIILINDGSRDKSLAVCQNTPRGTHASLCWTSKTAGRGCAQHRAQGRPRAIYFFVDSDDYWCQARMNNSSTRSVSISPTSSSRISTSS